MIRFNSVDFLIPKTMKQTPITKEVYGRSFNGSGYRDILFSGKNEYEAEFPIMTESQFNTLLAVVNTPSVAVECTITGHTFNFTSAQVRLAGEVEHGYSGTRINVTIIISQN
jgi:hypothetical protein